MTTSTTARPPRVLHGATFNVERGRRGKTLEAFIAFLGQYLVDHGLHFVMLQEVNAILPQLRSIPGYDLIAFPSSPDHGDNAILVRRDVDHGGGRTYKAGWFWFTKAGGKFPARSIVTVGLDGWLRLFNVHMPVQVLNHTNRFAGAARRIVAYRGTSALLARLVKRNTLPGCVAGGDWNATTDAAGTGTPNWVASQTGMLKRPGGRIDWVLSKGCQVTQIHVDTKNGGSDHKPVRFTVTEVPKHAPTKAPTKPAKAPSKPAGVVHAPPSVPIIAARWHGRSQTPKDVVIHGTVSPCAAGGARAVGRFFATENNKTSAHYGVDPNETIQYVGDHVVAYHCGHNQDSIGVELCDPQTGSAARWSDKNHKTMLARAATLVAQLCLAYDIPAVRIGPAQLVAGKHGICGHVDETLAFHQSTHTDPGTGFPWATFVHQVTAEITRLKA